MTTEIAQPATLAILSHWIDGRPVEVLPEQAEPVYNPATGLVIGRVPRGGAAEVDAAVAVALPVLPRQQLGPRRRAFQGPDGAPAGGAHRASRPLRVVQGGEIT
ncbi:MAG TPA: hypothetical protein VIK13_10485 [Candidatus Limnocylindrales bacterium]